MQGAWVGSFPMSEGDLRDGALLPPVIEAMASLMGFYAASAWFPSGMERLVLPMAAHSNRGEF